MWSGQPIDDGVAMSCDGCGRWLSVDGREQWDSVVELVAAARSEGWLVDEAWHACSECSAAFRDRKDGDG